MTVKQGKVLVTGASGYIALHCILELLNNGYEVKGSLRDLKREDEVRNSLGTEFNNDNLEFCKLNLLNDEQIIGADIYRDLINQVEELIREEDYEGQNYNAYKSRDPNFETIFKKRVKQIREDFPIPDQFKERIS